MKKKVFAIACVLIWLILIAPVVTPYIKTLFIHDGMRESKVVDIMEHVWDVDIINVADKKLVTYYKMPLGQKYGLNYRSTGEKDWILVSHFWITPGNIPVWLFAMAAVILYTALIALAIAFVVRVFLYFRKNMY